MHYTIPRLIDCDWSNGISNGIGIVYRVGWILHSQINVFSKSHILHLSHIFIILPKFTTNCFIDNCLTQLVFFEWEMKCAGSWFNNTILYCWMDNSILVGVNFTLFHEW